MNDEQLSEVRDAENFIITAAMHAHRTGQGVIEAGDLTDLAAAINYVMSVCPLCAKGGHDCPSCGATILHGASLCNSCAENTATLGDEDDHCRHSAGCPHEEVWIERTWADVRLYDTVRPPGQAQHEAMVTAIGPALPWHVAPAGSDAQYRPHEHRAEWASRRVTLSPLAGDRTPVTPDNGMNPAAAVEIKVPLGELAAIGLLGWQNRLDPM